MVGRAIYGQIELEQRPKYIKISSAVHCRGVAQPGSAPALGAGGPRFKSGRPDHYFLVYVWCCPAKGFRDLGVRSLLYFREKLLEFCVGCQPGFLRLLVAF
jgi:hypothetical protein